jgi:hypothetical protein
MADNEVANPPTLPPGATLVALPHVSKLGFQGATVSSLIFALINGGMSRCLFAFYGDYSTVMARNAAAQEALAKGAEWLWFIDSDMDFPIQTLQRLKDCDADIACTDMWSRNVPSFRTVLKYGPKDSKGKLQLFPHEGKGVEDVDCCGMACTLIRVSLIKEFAKKKLLPFQMAIHGEDAAFCMVAKQKFKASIKCDFGITAGHWGTSRMAGQDWTRDAKMGFGAIPDPDFMVRMGAKNVPGPGGNG